MARGDGIWGNEREPLRNSKRLKSKGDRKISNDFNGLKIAFQASDGGFDSPHPLHLFNGLRIDAVVTSDNRALS